MSTDETRQSHAVSSSRRRFLTGIAAAGASAALLPDLLRAQRAGQGVVDMHEHAVPLALAKLRGGGGGGGREWDVNTALAHMEEAGVTLTINSVSGSFWAGTPGPTQEAARVFNEFATKVSNDRPTKFGGWAIIPLPNVDQALKEIAYSLDVLKMDGVQLISSYESKWLGDPAFEPVFEELNRRKTVVFLHGAYSKCCDGLMPGIPTSAMEVPTDTARTVLSMVYAGTLIKFPEVKIIVNNGGGAIPMLAHRIEELTPPNPKTVPNGIENELKKFYYDTSRAVSAPAMAALMKLVPVSQIIFGSDGGAKEALAKLRKLGLSAADQKAIERENIAKLLPRARRT